MEWTSVPRNVRELDSKTRKRNDTNSVLGSRFAAKVTEKSLGVTATGKYQAQHTTKAPINRHTLRCREDAFGIPLCESQQTAQSRHNRSPIRRDCGAPLAAEVPSGYGSPASIQPRDKQQCSDGRRGVDARGRPSGGAARSSTSAAAKDMPAGAAGRVGELPRAPSLPAVPARRRRRGGSAGSDGVEPGAAHTRRWFTAESSAPPLNQRRRVLCRPAALPTAQ